MHATSCPRLLADIGGTNARLAWQPHRDAPLADVATYACDEHESLQAAIRHYLAAHERPTPPWCAIGIANPITGDRVQMTNHHWSFSVSQLQRELALERLKVINDFTALALSLPTLRASDLRQIGGGSAIDDAPRAVIGPGTGLGVSALVPTGAGFVALPGEGGHATLSAMDDREAEVLARMRRRFGHVSAERALSGPGLVNLYDAVCEMAGQRAEPLAPAEVILRARQQRDAACIGALEHFCAFLGGVAGNLALSFGARGGMYIGGGIAPRIAAEIAASRFRERFEAKGRLREYVAAIPSFIIDAQVSPALLGAAQALDLQD